MPNQNKNQNSNSKSVNNNVQGDLFTSKLVRGVPISEEIFDVPASTNQSVAQSKPSHTLQNILYGITACIILLLAFATFWFYRAAHTTNKTAADYGTTSADIAALTSAKTVTANGFVIINGNASVNGSVTANTFSGNGADLSNVNATRLNSQPGSFYQNANNIDSGTLNDARLSGNVVLLGSSPNFTNLLVTGTTTLQDTLAVSGAATFQTTVSVGGDLTVTGDTNINGLTYNWPATQASGVLSNDGSGNLAWQPVGACASCITDGGNAFGGSISVGTNDANSLYLRTNGVDQVILNTSGNLGIGVNPGYKLDVNGDVNVSAGNAFRIGGTAICTSGGCAASAGSTDYVQNSASLQTGVNFNFEIASINSVGGIIRAKAGQVSDLQQWQSSGGVALAYVDAAGDFNANSALKVNGTTVCTASGCTAAGGSGSYIQNGTALQTNANFNIQTVNAASIGGIIKGAVGQSVSLQEWQDSTGFTLALIDTNGAFLVQDNAGDYANVTPNDITLFNTNNYTTVAPGVIGAASNLDSSFTQIAPYTIYFGWTNGQVSSLQLTAQQVLALDVNTRFNIGKTLAVNSTGTLGTVERFRVNTPTTVDNLANVMVATTATTSKGLVIQAKASQTANLQEWQSSTGTQIGAVDASGRFVANTLGSADNATYLCRNSSNQIATCSGTATGTAFVQGGNSFGSTATLGTNDTNTLVIRTNSVTRETYDTTNNVYFGNGITNASPAAFAINATGGSGTNIAGASLTLAGGKGTGTGVGGNIVFQYAPAGNTGAVLNTLSTACTISGTNGSLSCPGAGASSERFGSGATAAGGNSTVFGNGASASASSAVSVGLNASAGGTSGSVAIGASSSASVSGAIAIGNSATSSGSGNVAIGNSASASFGNNVAIGQSASASGSSSSAFGAGTSAGHTGAIALGVGATTTVANQLVIGSNTQSITSTFIGNGVTNAAPAGITMNATGGSGTNIAGADLTIAAGRGTGTGAGGSISFQTAKAAAGTGSSLNALATVLTLNQTGQATFQNSTNSTTAFRVLGSAGNANLTVDTSGSQVIIGTASAITGKIVFQGSGGANNIALVGVNAPGGNRTLTLPDETGTLCSTGSVCSGYAGSSSTVLIGGNTTGSTLSIGTNDGNSLNFRTNSNVQMTIASGGATTLQNSTNSAAAFKVLDSGGTNNVIVADTTNDRVGIGTGTAAPTVTLDVLSAGADATTVAQFKNAGATSCTVQPGGTGFACSSDARLKTNILTLNNSSDIVNKLRGVSFNWLSNPTGQIQSGFIAQELMQVIPGAVSQDSYGFYVANYSAIVPYLVNAFQDSDKRLTTLEAKVNDIQLSQGVFNGGIVTGDIVFQAKATFDGVASFKGQTVFAGGATFEGVTNVKGRLQLSNNNTGVATIPNGGNSVHVVLPSTFSAAPNINLTPQDFVTGQYRVTHVTTTGFDIETSASQSENITFYWQAF
ncbi:MAG: tail fiber domain-containing protein [Candidatus Saccharibacteria bacterium]